MNYESQGSNPANIANESAILDNLHFKHVYGQYKGDVVLFALSTCGWCKKTRMYLEENEIEYDYIYVDLTSNGERDEVMEELKKYNPNASFPTLVIDEKDVIIGYEPEEIAKVLDISE